MSRPLLPLEGIDPGNGARLLDQVDGDRAELAAVRLDLRARASAPARTANLARWLNGKP
jgi:hypothetical protein